jgi:1-deoxy-D-xylulose-5-phosphate synthase
VLGLPDWYIEQGPQDLLRERYGLTADGIFESVKALVAQDVAGRASGSTHGKLAAVGSTKKRESLGDEQGS